MSRSANSATNLILGRNPIKEARERLEKAESYRQQGKFEQAEKLCLKLLGEHPDYFAALHTLGLTYADMKQGNRALGPLFYAATLNPKSWRTLTVLSGVCLDIKAREMAGRVLEQALAIAPENPNVLVTLGFVYQQQREYELGRAAFIKALKIDPTLHEASMGLVRCYEFLGEDKKAGKILKELISHGRRSVDILSSVTRISAGTLDIDILSKLDQLLELQPQAADMYPEQIALVRAHAYDRTGQYEDACVQLEKANRIYSSRLKTELANEKERGKFALNWLMEDQANKPNRSKNSPINLFILGPSRSGKTTLEAMVSQLEGVRRGFENTGVEKAMDRTFQDAGLIKSWSMKHLPQQFYPQFIKNVEEELSDRKIDGKVFTNTHPAYINNIYYWASYVPNSRFVLVKRNVDDLALRIYMRSYQGGNAYAYSLPTIKQHIAWYHHMMDAAADKFPDIVRIVSYEDMIVDANGVVGKIAKLCGLKPTKKNIMPKYDDRGCAKPYQDLLEL